MKIKLFALFYLLITILIYPERRGPYNPRKFGRPDRTFRDEKDEVNLFDIYDPLEPINRRVYYFNSKVDKFVLVPVTDFYKLVVPDMLEKGVSNFFSNIEEVNTFINSGFQLKWKDMFVTGGRFLINSTFGVAGLMDPSSHIGLMKRKEDFGQTLGHYGIDSGPFIILPIFGPSNLRDLSGIAFDKGTFLYIDPLEMIELSKTDPEILLLEGVDTRNNVSFSYYETGTSFEYEYIRLFYTKSRQLQIEN